MIIEMFIMHSFHVYFLASHNPWWRIRARLSCWLLDHVYVEQYNNTVSSVPIVKMGAAMNANIAVQQLTLKNHIYLVASELKDPICRSDECQIGSFSSEATICWLEQWNLLTSATMILFTIIGYFRIIYSASLVSHGLFQTYSFLTLWLPGRSACQDPDILV